MRGFVLTLLFLPAWFVDTHKTKYPDLRSCCCFFVSLSFLALHPLPYCLKLTTWVCLIIYFICLFQKTSPASQTERLYAKGKSHLCSSRLCSVSRHVCFFPISIFSFFYYMSKQILLDHRVPMN